MVPSTSFRAKQIPSCQLVRESVTNYPGKAISKDGTSIAFDQSGHGPAIILVAGATATRLAETSLASALAPHFTVFAYDRRGRGESGDTAPYAVEREVEDLEALINEAGGSAFVFGHSSGAVLTLEAARLLPTKITKLAVYEPPFMHHGTQELANILPNARRRTLEGQDHGPADEVLVPALKEFFLD